CSRNLRPAKASPPASSSRVRWRRCGSARIAPVTAGHRLEERRWSARRHLVSRIREEIHPYRKRSRQQGGDTISYRDGRAAQNDEDVEITTWGPVSLSERAEHHNLLDLWMARE